MIHIPPKLIISMYMLSLTLISIYYYLNVKSIGAGVGYVFLFLYILSVVIQIKNPFVIFYSIKKNILWVSLFLTYLCLRKTLDSHSFSGLISFMFGTTSGVFLAFGLGILTSFIFCNITNTLILLPGAINYFRKFLFFYFIVSLFFVLELLYHYYLMRVPTGFGIAVIPVAYQRPGILIFLFNIQNAILFSIYRSFSLSKRNYIGIFYYLIAIVSMILGQLIGSNFVFVGILLLSVLVLVYGRLVDVSRASHAQKKLSFGSFFYGWIGKEILLVGFISFVLIFLGLYALTYLSLIDLKTLRIFGDNWEIDSVTARFQLLDLLFFEHFNFAPIFGNMTVHNIMGTQYIHSLISLFTHLGITGFVLFFILCYFIYRDIERCGMFKHRVNFEYQLLRLLMITFILFISILSNFITWFPLWFVFGLFAASFTKPELSIKSFKYLFRK